MIISIEEFKSGILKTDLDYESKLLFKLEQEKVFDTSELRSGSTWEGIDKFNRVLNKLIQEKKVVKKVIAETSFYILAEHLNPKIKSRKLKQLAKHVGGYNFIR